MTETDVLVVGAGPVGLALSLELTDRGVAHLVVDSSDGVIVHPKVSTVGPRTMEHFRRWKVADRVRSVGFPTDHSLDVAWVTAVGRHEIHRFVRGTGRSRPVFAHTPEPDQVCPAHLLNPILAKTVGHHPDGPLRYRCHLEDLTQDSDCVRARIRDLRTGNLSIVVARYVVAADGASSGVRTAVGIDVQDHDEPIAFRNILFSAPELSRELSVRGHQPALVYFLVGSAELRYPLRSVDGKGLYNMVVAGESTLTAEQLVRAAVAFETPFTVLADSRWLLRQWVTEHYRKGRVFLAGDAAHGLSPSGGFGMNTGVGDAVDLGWKLAATIDGWAGPGLLETYDTERRPIARAALEAAGANLARTIHREVPEDLSADTVEGARARTRMAELLQQSSAAHEFDAPDVHFGFAYRSSAVISDGTDADTPSANWRPASDPGTRAAHAWVSPGVSTLDLFGDGFTLVCFSDDDRRGGMERAFAERRVPLKVERWSDPNLARLYGQRFVLVRPDGHVSWRGNRLPETAPELVDAVRGAL